MQHLTKLLLAALLFQQLLIVGLVISDVLYMHGVHR